MENQWKPSLCLHPPSEMSCPRTSPRGGVNYGIQSIQNCIVSAFPHFLVSLGFMTVLIILWCVAVFRGFWDARFNRFFRFFEVSDSPRLSPRLAHISLSFFVSTSVESGKIMSTMSTYYTNYVKGTMIISTNVEVTTLIQFDRSSDG